MNLREALRTIRTIPLVIRYFRNWREIISLMAKGQRPRKITLRNGIAIETSPNNTPLAIATEIFIDNVYTQWGLSIEPSDVVVDIGANIGTFALYAARKTKNAIYAFEPFTENFEFLEKNLHANNFRNVTLEQIAVSNKNGMEKLYLSGISGGHLLFDHNNKGQLYDYVHVPTKMLEKLMEKHSIKKIDFLKIDCEGSEGQILQSTSRKCLEKTRKIAMEFHDNVSILKHDEIKRLLESSGFSCNLNWDGASQFGYLYARRN